MYLRTAFIKVNEGSDKGFWPEAAVARTDFLLSKVIKLSREDLVELEGLLAKATLTLSRLLPFDPLDGGTRRGWAALFDHLTSVFSEELTALALLKYVL